MSDSNPIQRNTPSNKNPRPCGAKKRDGTPCPTPAMKGGLRCRMHGGASPQAMRTAKARLMELREPAIVALQQIVADERREDRDRLRAAIAILDRTGMGPSQTIEVDQLKPWQVAVSAALGRQGKPLPEGIDPEALAEATETDLRRRLHDSERERKKLAKRARKRARRGADEVIDAEVVEDNTSSVEPSAAPQGTPSGKPKKRKELNGATVVSVMPPPSKDPRAKAMKRAGYVERPGR
jgi:hypothetical protein